MKKSFILGSATLAMSVVAITANAQNDEYVAGPFSVNGGQYFACNIANNNANNERYDIQAFCQSRNDVDAIQYFDSTPFMIANEVRVFREKQTQTSKTEQAECWCKVLGDGDPDALLTIEVMRGKKRYLAEQGMNTEDVP